MIEKVDEQMYSRNTTRCFAPHAKQFLLVQRLEKVELLYCRHY
jgi:hypothetical protein